MYLRAGHIVMPVIPVLGRMRQRIAGLQSEYCLKKTRLKTKAKSYMKCI